MIQTRLYISVLIAMLSLGIQAQAQVKISGKVVDSDNEPIEFATVRVDGTAIGTGTDLRGEYSLNVAQSDTIELIFNCIGYKEYRQKLIDAKGEMVVNAKLFKNTRQL